MKNPAIKALIAGVVGGLVIFFWGFVVHTVVHLHSRTIHPLPDEAAFVATMQETGAATGVYFVPFLDRAHDDADAQQAADDQWKEAARRGPIALMMYRAEGVEPMAPITFIRGALLFVLASTVAALMLIPAAPKLSGYLGRVVFIASFGVVVALFSDFSMWNWWHAPLDYAGMLALDHIIGWTLAGLAIAAIVKPAP
jgi:hypothetical protein